MALLDLGNQGGHTFGGSRVELSGTKGRIVLESDSSLQMNDDGQRLFGATGAAQVVEIVRQLRGEAGERQVEGAKIGLTHATGGGISGFDHGACSIHIFSR